MPSRASLLPASRRQFLKRILALGTCGRAADVWAAADAPTRPGVHGMVLFGGREGLYGSHMPMFHAPHDVQAVFRLRSSSQDHERRLREAVSARPGLWSLEPEPFDLSRTAPNAAAPLTRFTARVFEGHFERGGKVRLEQTMFEIERVLLYRPLDGALRQASSSEFLWIGDGIEHFLVKHLDQRPDIDLIGQFTTHAAARADGRRLALSIRGLAPPASPDTQVHLHRRLAQQGARLRGDVRWLYAETEDLR